MLKMADGKYVINPKWEPVSFWPYATVVTDRLMRKDYAAGDACDQLCNALLELFKKSGFKDIHNDNKIAFGLRDDKGNVFYIGFKDWVMAVGKGFQTDEWNKNREQKVEDANVQAK